MDRAAWNLKLRTSADPNLRGSEFYVPALRSDHDKRPAGITTDQLDPRRRHPGSQVLRFHTTELVHTLLRQQERWSAIDPNHRRIHRDSVSGQANHPLDVLSSLWVCGRRRPEDPHIAALRTA